MWRDVNWSRPHVQSFVPNMIGGASQADLAVLVISARKGEFETGFERGGQVPSSILCSSVSDPDPDSIRSVDPDSESGSMTHKRRQKFRNFMF